MKAIHVICVLVLQLSGLAYASEQPLAVPNDLPFKKSLTLTSLLLFQNPIENTKQVEELSERLKNYAILESKAIEVIRPLQQARKTFKEVVRNTIFRDQQDLKMVIEQLNKDTDENTSHNIEELQRDHLIQFNGSADPIAGSTKYISILEVAKLYQDQQSILKKHWLFEALENARKDLKVSMHAFLHKNYSTVEQLQEDFNKPVRNVNVFLDAMQNP